MDYKGLELNKNMSKTGAWQKNIYLEFKCIFKHIKTNHITSIKGFIGLSDISCWIFFKLLNKMENGTTHTTCLFLQLLLRRMKTGIDTPNYSNSPEYINAINISLHMWTS